jgi:glycine oxidase
MPVSQPDIILIGGGVIGLTTALKLAERGVSVTLLDRQTTGREASWAGAGMLPPGNLARAATPESRLRSYSHAMWKSFSAELMERTGIDNGYHVCGSVNVITPEKRGEYNDQYRQWENEGVRVERLSRHASERLVADLNPLVDEVAFLPDFGQVRNPRHLQALQTACLQRGVEIVEHAEGLNILTRGNRISEIRISNRSLVFDRVCITAGAWSATILQSLGFPMPVKPVRGQIVQLRLSAPPFQCVIEHGRRYLVPRRDGLILIGSTEEDVGFVKQTTTDGVLGLLEFSKSLVPSLACAEVVRSWAGLRPGSPDELPLLGAVPGFSNLFVGAGHFRSGLQMSPGTATILADLLLDAVPAISLEGLTADRFFHHVG